MYEVAYVFLTQFHNLSREIILLLMLIIKKFFSSVIIYETVVQNLLGPEKLV